MKTQNPNAPISGTATGELTIAPTGPLNKSNPDGTFVGAIHIPDSAAPGPAQLCVRGVFATSCTPLTIAAAN